MKIKNLFKNRPSKKTLDLLTQWMKAYNHQAFHPPVTQTEEILRENGIEINGRVDFGESRYIVPYKLMNEIKTYLEVNEPNMYRSLIERHELVDNYLLSSDEQSDQNTDPSDTLYST